MPFTVPKTPEELRREQEEAARGVPPVFDYRPAAGDSVVGGRAPVLRARWTRGCGRRRRGRSSRPSAARWTRRGCPRTLGAIEVLADASRRLQLQAATELAVREQFPRGVAAASPEREGFSAVQVRGLPGGERLLPADSVFTADQFYRAAQERLPADAGVDAAELQRLLLVRWFRPSLAEDERADGGGAGARGGGGGLGARSASWPGSASWGRASR